MITLDGASLVQQEYWIRAMTAARAAGRRRPRPRRQSQPTQRSPHPTLQRNTYLFRRRIDLILRQMKEDLDLTYGNWRLKRRLDTAETLTNGSNKRLRKPD